MAAVSATPVAAGVPLVTAAAMAVETAAVVVPAAAVVVPAQPASDSQKEKGGSGKLPPFLYLNPAFHPHMVAAPPL